MSETVHLIECDPQHHRDAIGDILNEAIAHSTALWDYAPRSGADMAGWFAAHRRRREPVVGAVDGEGRLLGFATYGPFRDRPANKYAVEHSIYVHRDHRGRGIGAQLLVALVAAAQARHFRLMVGAIEAGNEASIRLHEAHGFTHAGTIKDAGFKFGRWMDLAFYQRILPGPAQPVDG